MKIYPGWSGYFCGSLSTVIYLCIDVCTFIRFGGWVLFGIFELDWCFLLEVEVFAGSLNIAVIVQFGVGLGHLILWRRFCGRVVGLLCSTWKYLSMVLVLDVASLVYLAMLARRTRRQQKSKSFNW